MRKARFLRVGKTILAYRTRDGEETALSFRNENGFMWKKNLSGKCRAGIKKAIEIMEGRRTPRLLDLPINTLQIKKGNPND